MVNWLLENGVDRERQCYHGQRALDVVGQCRDDAKESPTIREALSSELPRERASNFPATKFTNLFSPAFALSVLRIFLLLNVPTFYLGYECFLIPRNGFIAVCQEYSTVFIFSLFQEERRRERVFVVVFHLAHIYRTKGTDTSVLPGETWLRGDCEEGLRSRHNRQR